MKNALVFTLILLGALAVVEGGIRVIRPVGDIRIAPDPDLLFRIRPGSRSYFTDLDTGERHLAVYDETGMRGARRQLAGAAPRIAVYGDSFVEASFTREEFTFTRQLENALKEKGLSDVVVMNAGVQGYGPDQELRRMQRELGEARPDLIVWCLFSGNDYGDLLRNRMVSPRPESGLRWRKPVLAAAIRNELAAADSAPTAAPSLKRSQSTGRLFSGGCSGHFGYWPGCSRAIRRKPSRGEKCRRLGAIIKSISRSIRLRAP